MTDIYAHLHDATIKEAWVRYQQTRIDINGQMIDYNPEAPTASAEWVKHNLAAISASLPNGYCGRPPQQECPHPNACLVCPDFQTTVEFLPIHRQQADNNRTHSTDAECRTLIDDIVASLIILRGGSTNEPGAILSVTASIAAEAGDRIPETVWLARTHGYTWDRIGERLALSAGAARKRYRYYVRTRTDLATHDELCRAINTNRCRPMYR
jgi:hypothetical protein